MRFEIVDDDCIDVFINKYNFRDFEIVQKDILLTTIKDLILKMNIRYKLNLSGFYKIKVFPNDKLGVFLNIIKIDDNDFSNEAEFRIIVYNDEKFFLETDEVEMFDRKILKRYYNGKFYMDIDEIDNIFSFIDMGNIIYGDDVKKMLINSKVIK